MRCSPSYTFKAGLEHCLVKRSTASSRGEFGVGNGCVHDLAEEATAQQSGSVTASIVSVIADPFH
jgi:hypothetical protein